MDHIWGAAETWQECLPAIEMSVFQEELIARGLKEHADEADAMPASVQFLLMYTAVLAGELSGPTCHDFHRFSSFSTKSQTLTLLPFNHDILFPLSYLILSFFFFILSSQVT